jgi:hypothetical protein
VFNTYHLTARNLHIFLLLDGHINDQKELVPILPQIAIQMEPDLNAIPMRQYKDEK